MAEDPQVKVLSQAPTYQRCVQAPTLPFLAIRDEYLALANGDPCSAALLGIFEHWTNLRQAQNENAWIVRTHDQLVEALRGIWSKIDVRRALAKLMEWGFVERRSGEGFDKRSRWRFVVDCVQSALEQIFRRDRESRSEDSIEHIEGIGIDLSKESGDQIDVIGGADDIYIDSLDTESSEESSTPEPRASAREGGGGFSIPDASLQMFLQNASEPFQGNLPTRAATPQPPSSALPPSPKPHITAMALYLARQAYDAGRVKTTMEQYAAGIAARMMQSEVVPAVPARGQEIAGERAMFVME